MKEVARAIIADKEGRILLGKRAGGTAAGQWALVGGKPDAGETSQEAIIREVKEELGLDFEPELYLEEVDSKTDPENPWKAYFFTGLVKNFEALRLNRDEIAEILFVMEADLANLEIAFDHRERLIEYFARK